MNKRVKIVATLGPAVEIRGGKKFGDDGYWGEKLDVEASAKNIAKLIEAGANTFRFNFSHGDHQEQGERMATVKLAEKLAGKKVGFLLDTKGPEIRIGRFEEKEYFLKPDDIFTITTRDVIGNKDIVSVSYEGLPNDVEKGSIISIDDGLIQLEVMEIKDGTDIVCRVQNNGVISNNKGVNLPGRVTNLPAITPKDVDDIKFGIENGIDMIAASFIRKKEDIYDIRKVLEDHGGEDILILSKIESQEGVDNIDEIIEASDGIMVARGDLGVEIRTELIPLVQKEVIRKCNKAAKPVITATQMLDSMQRNPRPTRAETTDVANAIIDGTDCVMLSGETAAGKYPIEAVKTMRDICITTELSDDFEENIYQTEIDRKITTTNAISKSTCTIASQLNAKAIITCTASGNTAKAVSKFRPKTNIIACTIDEKVARRLSVTWGVYPIIVEKAHETDELIERAIVGSLKENYVQEGDLTVLTAGIPLGVSGTSNLIKVHVIGDIIANGTGVGNKSVSAKVVVGSTKEELEEKFEDGDIIVAKYTDKDINEFMERSSGVISENGGLTSHTAVVSIHFGIPAILGVKNVTDLLSNGDIV
ncbi:MAG: pyruvate kinase, partial [Anaerococcus sp.]|nr:pyruvate kinase [Anaerococcus sp.]